MSVSIKVEHSVTHIYTQNGLAEAFIKHLQLIAQTLVMRTKLLVSTWGYAILHTSMLIRLRPTTTQSFSPSQLVTGYEPNVLHLHVFRFIVYVPIVSPLHIKMGYDLSLIIPYLEPLTCNFFCRTICGLSLQWHSIPVVRGDKNINFLGELQEFLWLPPLCLI